MPLWLFYIDLVLFGLAFGSFANVVIWRFPRGESLSEPPSHCPRCNARIAWYDNIPLVSWALLGGRCRSCGEPISARYPAVEALTGALWLLAGVQYGMTLKCAAAITLYYLLELLAFIDADTRRLPNRLVAILFITGAVGAVVAQVTGVQIVPLLPGSGAIVEPLAGAFVGAALGAGVMLVLGWGYRVLRATAGFGMGDVKLMGAIGLFTGPYVLLVLFFASILGSLYGLVIARRAPEGMRAHFPFGPFLAIGTLLACVAGPSLWGWYVSLVA